MWGLMKIKSRNNAAKMPDWKAPGYDGAQGF